MAAKRVLRPRGLNVSAFGAVWIQVPEVAGSIVGRTRPSTEATGSENVTWIGVDGSITVPESASRPPGAACPTGTSSPYRRWELLPRPGGGRDGQHAEAVRPGGEHAGCERRAAALRTRGAARGSPAASAEQARPAREMKHHRRVRREMEERATDFRLGRRQGLRDVLGAPDEPTEPRRPAHGCPNLQPLACRELPTGRIFPSRSETATGRPAASRTETAATCSPVPATVTFARACGSAAIAAPGQVRRIASRPPPATSARTRSTTSTIGARERLRRRRRAGYREYDSTRADTS